MKDITIKLDSSQIKNRSNFKKSEIYRAQIEQATKNIIKQVAELHFKRPPSLEDINAIELHKEIVKEDDIQKEVLLLKHDDVILGELRTTIGQKTWLFFIAK